MKETMSEAFERLYMCSPSVRSIHNSTKDSLDRLGYLRTTTNISSEEKHRLKQMIYMQAYGSSANISNLCNEIFLGTNKPKENPMSLKVTRPVLVGNVNILTAKDFELASIIRQAKKQIETNKDLQELSQHYKVMAKELKEVIALCVEQLDKDTVKPEVNVGTVGHVDH